MDLVIVLEKQIELSLFRRCSDQVFCTVIRPRIQLLGVGQEIELGNR